VTLFIYLFIFLGPT